MVSFVSFVSIQPSLYWCGVRRSSTTPWLGIEVEYVANALSKMKLIARLNRDLSRVVIVRARE